MQNLPSAETYEKEFRYMPWGILIREVQAMIVLEAKLNGSLLDLMCGPGYLLGQIEKQRPDLALAGIDLESEFIKYAEKRYPGVKFIVADTSVWKSDERYDMILCTAGLHHLPDEKQEPFIQSLAALLKEDGFAIVADPYIDDYSNEQERKLAGAKLGYEYLAATIRNGATDDVVQAAIEVLRNDVFLVEWKSSAEKMKPLFEKYFASVEMHKTWPDGASGYGDYCFILKK
jgi:trans-aconitate methyltransferase